MSCIEIVPCETNHDFRWYCARTKPSQTYVAIDNLRRQQFETYYPMLIIERIKSGKIRNESEPLFPGYVLVRTMLANATWRAINSTRGVLKLLSAMPEGPPSPIRHGEIEKLKANEAAGKLHISEVVRLNRGDIVRIKNGAFAGGLGYISHRKRERVRMLIHLLGGEIVVNASVADLELVERGRSTSPQIVARAI